MSTVSPLDVQVDKLRDNLVRGMSARALLRIFSKGMRFRMSLT
jgi:hypothetical protein